MSTDFLQVGRKVELKLVFVADKCFGDLIWAAGGFKTASDALRTLDDVINLHTCDEGRNAKKVAGAATDNFYFCYGISVDFKYILSGADASGVINKFHRTPRKIYIWGYYTSFCEKKKGWLHNFFISKISLNDTGVKGACGMKKFFLILLLSVLLLYFAQISGTGAVLESFVDELMRYISLHQGNNGGETAVFIEGEESSAEIMPLPSAAGTSEFALCLGEITPSAAEKQVFEKKLDIRNDSSIEIDAESLMAENPVLPSAKGEPQVLIIHTHGSEAYTQTDGDNYIESDPYRTEDKSRNVIKVGDVLAEVLESKGIGVIHDRELYDSPSYTGSYTRSGEAVEKYLRRYPSIAVVIDLHRDAIGSGDTAYKTRAEPALGSCAQIMLLVGTGENGLYHPEWRENMRLALFIQQAMEERYPSLARPLAVKSERYNQHLSPGAMIVEVGTNGNTLAEAVTAISLFGDAAGDVLKSFMVYE